MPSEWNIDYNDRRESPGSRSDGFMSGLETVMNMVNGIVNDNTLSDAEKLDKIQSDMNERWMEYMKHRMMVRENTRMVINEKAFG